MGFPRMNGTAVLPRGMVAAGVILGALLSGCQLPEAQTAGPGQAAVPAVARVPTEPNVVKVVAIYTSPSPWIWNEDKDRVLGIYVSGLYLLGPKGRGVFGDGVIRPRIYLVETGPDGTKHPKLVRELSFTVEEAIPFRGKQPRPAGWGYGLPVSFGDLDLSGREIQVVICFERSDGGVVPSSKKTFIVPKAGK